MRYVLETRKSNSELFPPKTIYLLLSGILRHARQVNTHAPNFLDKNNIKFQSLHAVLDNLFKALQKDGVAQDTKHAEIISKEDEIKLWEAKVIGTENHLPLYLPFFALPISGNSIKKQSWRSSPLQARSQTCSNLFKFKSR